MSSAGAHRPNILFIQSDSHDGRLMGCMGHPAMARATPNMDGLARRGVLFSQAYSNNPICCPSRASTWSGQWTFHCEGWNNYKGLEPGTPTFQSRLDAAGYLTHTVGKTDYLSGAHTHRARVTAWDRSACIMRPCYRDHPPLVREGDGPRIHKLDWDSVQEAGEWLGNVAAGAGRPWMLYVGLHVPHPGFTTSAHYLSLLDEAGVDAPGRDDHGEHPVMRHMRTVKNWEHGTDAAMARQVRRTYFGMVSETDALVGELLAALAAAKLQERTVVILTSDHGELALEHRQLFKMCHFEPAVCVPLIVAGPDVARARRVDSLLSLVDLFPTLMDLTGTDRPAGLDGRSLLPELSGSSDPDRPAWVLSEFHDSACCTGSFMLRGGPWKLIEYVGYEPMLFDLSADPGELRNLAASEPAVLARLRRQLAQVVNAPAVDAKVKAYDRASFEQWRREHRRAGDYQELMARIHSGWEMYDQPVRPWMAADEERINRWLASENLRPK